MTPSFAFRNILEPQLFASATGTVFRGLTITQRHEGFNIVLRALRADGTGIYSMTVDENPQDGLQKLFEALCSRSGDGLWRHDKFYSPGG